LVVHFVCQYLISSSMKMKISEHASIALCFPMPVTELEGMGVFEMRGARLTNRQRIDNMLDLITDLAGYSSQGVPIIVEGKKDESALKALGIEGRIIRVRQNKKRLFELAEELAPYKAVIILTDFDHEGEELADELSKYLHSLGVQTLMRDKIRGVVSWASRQVEGLSRIDSLRENLNKRQFIIKSS
jgi:5S rRNA maturation endonuclease (ribonuclease M5)